MPRGDFASEAEFRQAVDGLLKRTLQRLDECDPDLLDASMTTGNLVLRFSSGATFVLSQQAPTRELWLSANLRAWHFVHEGGRWVERDTGEPMLPLLAGLIAEKLGQPVQLSD